MGKAQERPKAGPGLPVVAGAYDRVASSRSVNRRGQAPALPNGFVGAGASTARVPCRRGVQGLPSTAKPFPIHAAAARDAVISPCDCGQTRPGLWPFLGFAHPLRVLCRCSRRLRAMRFTLRHARGRVAKPCDCADKHPGLCPPWFVGIRSGLSSPAHGLRAMIHAAAAARRAASLRLGTQTAGPCPSWFASLAPVHPHCSARLRAIDKPQFAKELQSMHSNLKWQENRKFLPAA